MIFSKKLSTLMLFASLFSAGLQAESKVPSPIGSISITSLLESIHRNDTYAVRAALESIKKQTKISVFSRPDTASFLGYALLATLYWISHRSTEPTGGAIYSVNKEYMSKVKEIVELLIANGANVNYSHERFISSTPLQLLAKSFNHWFIYNRLNVRPQEVNATIGLFTDIATSLVNAGAKINQRSKEGKTALWYLESYGDSNEFTRNRGQQTSLYQYLISKGATR